LIRSKSRNDKNIGGMAGEGFIFMHEKNYYRKKLRCLQEEGN